MTGKGEEVKAAHVLDLETEITGEDDPGAGPEIEIGEEEIVPAIVIETVNVKRRKEGRQGVVQEIVMIDEDVISTAVLAKATMTILVQFSILKKI